MFVEIRVCNYKKKAQLIAPRTLNSLYFNFALISIDGEKNFNQLIVRVHQQT